MRPLLPALLLSLLLPGCVISRETTNEPLLPDAIADLRPGTTTAAEASAALGAPSQVVELGERSAWRYEYTVSKEVFFTLLVVSFVNLDRRSDRRWLFFDKDDVLTNVGTTLEAADSRYAMPWQDVR